MSGSLPRPISAVLLVKGAGLQRQGDTLDLFVRGFWPEVRALDPTARLRGGNEEMDLQIDAATRSVLIREVNWEAALRPRGAFASLRGEWLMSTCVLTARSSDAQLPSRVNEVEHPRLAHYVRAFSRTSGLFWSTFFIYLVAIMVLTRRDPDGIVATLAVAGASAVIAWLPVWAVALHDPEFDDRRALPSSLLLPLLALVFVLRPLDYLLLFSIVMAFVAAAVVFAADRWQPGFRDDAAEASVPRELRLLAGAGFVYRLAIVISLPMMALALGVAHLLDWIPATRRLGRGLANLASRVLSGIMGDVVTYALDPLQAARVQHVLARDIARVTEHPDVDAIHVVAHSQGTALSFECLYGALSAAERRKLRTFVTMGSPLTFYHRAQPSIDDMTIERFPPRQYPAFPTGFRWLNFWSFSDPITEFSGLDEYLVPTSGPGAPTALTGEPAPNEHTGPESIKTRFNLLRNHSDYWREKPTVLGPLAARVLHDASPDAWAAPTPATAAASRVSEGAHLVVTYAVALLILAVGVGLLVMLWSRFGHQTVTLLGQAAARAGLEMPDLVAGLPAAERRLDGPLSLAAVLVYGASLLAPWTRLTTKLSHRAAPAGGTL